MSLPNNTFESATALVYRVGRLLRFRVAKFLKNNAADITPEQWGLLLQLDAMEGCVQGELADPVLGDHPNVTRMLDQLSKKELVERRPSPKDRRSHCVRLTDKGRANLDTLRPRLAKEKAFFYSGLSEQDLAELRRMLRIIEKNLCAAEVD